jgi:energy-coupling factor transporter ATP-binding protein EcfA2
LQLNFTSNLLVLDEVFDGLDTIGCNRVIDMISNLSDVKNVFVVTHRKDLSIPSDKELIVVKSSVGITEMRY